MKRGLCVGIDGAAAAEIWPEQALFQQEARSRGKEARVEHHWVLGEMGRREMSEREADSTGTVILRLRIDERTDELQTRPVSSRTSSLPTLHSWEKLPPERLKGCW